MQLMPIFRTMTCTEAKHPGALDVGWRGLHVLQCYFVKLGPMAPKSDTLIFAYLCYSSKM